MQYIGKINRNKIGEYAEKIVTDDVILTDERKLHIYEDHKNDYEYILDNIESAIIEPSEILKDSKNDNTLMFIRKLEKNNLNVIVKLNTTESKEHPLNSIMTAWIIREKNLKRLREKNETIYKNE